MTNNSLREEIACKYRKTNCWELADKLADIACEEFEKRIDSRIAYYTERGGLEIIQELQNMKEMLK